MTLMLIPEELLSHFQSAGWRPGRSVSLPDSITAQISAGHPALPILAAFSGITVGKCKAGEQCATSDVAFGFVERSYQADVWSGLLGTVLVGIASVHHDHGELYVDLAGRFYGVSTIHDATCYEGTSFGEAMRGLLCGIRCRPMLRPDQQSVTFYGDEFTADSPEVYDYSRAL
jgi:hypothetical protein